MKKIIYCAALLMIVVTFGLYGIPDVTGAEKKPVAKKGGKAEQKAASIEAAGTLSKDHPEIPAGITCVDCHEVKLDAKTTATQAWLEGAYLKYNPGEGVMPQDKVKEEIAKFIGGRKGKRTFVLGTCINNTPLTTTADFSFDPETMTLYGLHEKGTVKLLHIKQNPRVSLNWHKEFENWGDVQCGQFIGTAELLDGTSPEFEKVLVDCYPYEEMAAKMKLEPAQAREMVKKGMVLSKITVNEVTLNLSAFEKQGMRKYQRWIRPAK